MNKSKLCINCFKNIDISIDGGKICPSCGYNNNIKELKGSLKFYTVLQDRYIIGRVKSANGEGFTYAALDRLLNIIVDIREFYPTTLVYRDGENLCPAEGMDESFTKYFNEFLDMSRGLIRLKGLAAITPVIDLFLQNNTAYLVYEHFDSVSLKSYIESKDGKIDWNTASDLFLPMINSLSSMHALAIKHLGISPETLRVCKDGKMRLSEFSIESVRRVGRGLEPDLLSGCPAYEQYTKNMICNEITDVYAFSACILYALTGALPAGANKRIDDERLMISRDTLKTVPPHIIKAIANGLQLRQEDRIGTFERLRAEIITAPTVTSEMEGTTAIKSLPKAYQNVPNDKAVSPKLWLVLSFVVTIIALLGFMYYLFTYTDFSFDDVASAIDKTLETSSLEVVQVPNMVGDEYKDWVDKIKDTNVYRFSLKISSEEFSDTIKEGIVISQKPAAGGAVKKGEAVEVVISQGLKDRELPNVRGMQFSKAVEVLEKQGFKVLNEEEQNSSVVAGNVLWYAGDNNEGDVLPYGSTVTIVVSSGK